MKTKVYRDYGTYLGISFERFFNTDSLEGEIWKPINGYDGRFFISNFGRCISKARLVEGKKSYQKKMDNILCPHDNGHGYMQYTIENQHKYIHRLVAQEFIPNPLNKREIDHIDGNKSNNVVENLRWATRSENASNPITLKMNIMHQTKRPVIQLNIDGEFVKEWDGVCAAAKGLNVSRERLSDILSSKRKSKTIGIYQFLYKEDYDKNKDYTLFSPEPQGDKRLLSLKTVAFVSENTVIDAFSSLVDASKFVGFERRKLNWYCLQKKYLIVYYENKPIMIKVYRYKELSDSMKKDTKWLLRNKYPLK